MSETILPCPFCGGRDIEARDKDDGTPVVWFVCNDCSAHGPYDDWRPNALHRWNTRTSPPTSEGGA